MKNLLAALAFFLCVGWMPHGVGTGGGGGQTVTAVALNFHPDGINYVSGSGVVTGTLYFSGGCPDGTEIGTLTSSVSGGGSYSGTWSLTGTNAASFKTSGVAPALLECNGTVAAGSYSFNAVAGTNSFTQAISAYAGNTFWISNTGNDSTGTGTSGNPWLTPAHAATCGDFFIATTGYTHVMSSVGSSTCAGQDNRIWVKCQTFAGCTINGNAQQFYARVSYWGVQGFVFENATNSAIKFSQASGGGTTAHFAVANSVILNAGGSGVQGGQDAGTGNGTDYEIVIGNLLYNNGTAAGPCFSNISFAGDSNFDTNSGTHRYVALNVGSHSLNGSGCSGTGQTTDGEFFIWDQPDVNCVTTGLLVEKNVAVANGGVGIEIFEPNTCAGTQSSLVRYNTAAGNVRDPLHSGNPNTDILLQGEANATYTIVTAEFNLSASYATTTGLNPGTQYALQDSLLVSASSAVDGDWLYAPNTQSIINFHTPYTCPFGSGSITSPGGGSNTDSCAAHGSTLMSVGSDPVFAGAAYCTGVLSSGALTVSGCTGAAVASGMLIYATSGTQITSGTKITGGSGTSWTTSGTQTIASFSLVGLPDPPSPSCGSSADALACAATIISNYTPTKSGSTAYGYGGSLACDANNSTPDIQNVERSLPSDMDPCG